MITNFSIGDLVIDCADAERACDFYAGLMGWEKTVAYDLPAVKADRGMLFLFAETDIPYAPPIWPEEPGRQQKQMHLDLSVDDLPSGVDEAIHLGATKATVQFGGTHVTMIDTERHPFCLCQRGSKLEYYEKKGYTESPHFSINIDCNIQKALRGFYAQLTDWDQEFHPAVLITDNRMVVCYQGCDVDATMDIYIPPVWPEEPGQQQKQMYFIHKVDELTLTVEEAIRLGAIKAAKQFSDDCIITLIDPEGHPFCLRTKN